MFGPKSSVENPRNVIHIFFHMKGANNVSSNYFRIAGML